LQALPWEYLRVTEAAAPAFHRCGVRLESRFLALHPNAVFVRRAGGPTDGEYLRPLGKLKVLVAWANPAAGGWESAPSVEDEARRLAGCLLRELSDHVELREAPAATAEQLRAVIREFQPNVVHFTGHGHSPLRTLGAGRPNVPALVCGAPGRAEYFTAVDMLAAIRETSAAIFVFNCCFGAFSHRFAASFAGELLSAEQVRVVIANQGSISVAAAAAFTVRLYRTLALGQAVDAAVAEFRRMLVQKHALGEDSLDWGMPVVYQRDAVTRLWEFIRSDAAPVDFGRIFAAYEFFVGRAFLDRRVGQYADELRTAGRGGLFLLTAAPGVGKTAFLVEFIRRRSSAVIHFLYRATEGYRDPDGCLRWIYNSVLARYGWLDREPKYSVLGLQELLKRAGAESLARGEMQLIVIDALDEAAAERGHSAADVIPAVIPAGVCVIAASRPGPIADELLARAGVEHFELAAESAESMEDARAACELMIAELCPDALRTDAEAIQSLAARLAEKAAGNFLVLCAFFDAQKIEGQSLARLEEESGDLTSKVTDIYKRFFDQRLLKDLGGSLEARRAVYTLLQALASAEGPVTRAMVCGAFEMRSADWEYALGHVQQFLSEGGFQDAGRGETTYHLFHQTFREYLHERFETDLREARNRWTAYTEGWRGVTGYARHYALENLPMHLAESGNCDRLRLLLLDLEFAARRCLEFGPYGYTALFSQVLDCNEETQAVERALDQTTHLQAREPGLFLQHLQNNLQQRLAESERVDELVTPVPCEQQWLRVTGKPPLGSAAALLRTFEAHECVNSVAFAPDCALLASACSGNTVKLWETRSGLLRHSLQGHWGDVTRVAFAPDGEVLATGARDSTVNLWQVRTGRLLRRLEGHHSEVNAVAFSPDGSVLASGSRDNAVRVWDARTGQLLLTLTEHQSPVFCVGYAPDGSVLASGSENGRLILWDARTGELIRALVAHQHWVASLAYAPDGAVLASGSGDGGVKLWCAHTGQLLNAFPGQQGNNVWSVAYAPGGTVLACGLADGTVKLRDARTGNLIRLLAGHKNPVISVAYAPDGTMLATGSSDTTAKLWDVRPGHLSPIHRGHSGTVASAAYGRDAVLATASSDGMVKLWEARSGQLLRTLEGHKSWVATVVYDPNREVLASASGDRTVKLWDARTSRILRTLRGHRECVLALAYAPDGMVLASGSQDGTVKLWDAHSGRLVRTLDHGSGVSSLAYAPDGAVLAVGTMAGTAELFDVRRGRLIATLGGHRGWVHSVAFMWDGAGIAVGSLGGTLNLWKVSSAHLIHTLQDHGSVEALACSPNGTMVVSGSRDGEIYVWHTRTGSRLCRREFTSSIVAVHFVSARHFFVAEAGEGGVPRHWDFLVEDPP
jgi:WD40 repeat protein